MLHNMIALVLLVLSWSNACAQGSRPSQPNALIRGFELPRGSDFIQRMKEEVTRLFPEGFSMVEAARLVFSDNKTYLDGAMGGLPGSTMPPQLWIDLQQSCRQEHYSLGDVLIFRGEAVMRWREPNGELHEELLTAGDPRILRGIGSSGARLVSLSSKPLDETLYLNIVSSDLNDRHGIKNTLTYLRSRLKVARIAAAVQTHYAFFDSNLVSPCGVLWSISLKQPSEDDRVRLWCSANAGESQAHCNLFEVK